MPPLASLGIAPPDKAAAFSPAADHGSSCAPARLQPEGEARAGRGEADAEEGAPEAARNAVEDDLTLEANEGVFQVRRIAAASRLPDPRPGDG